MDSLRILTIATTLAFAVAACDDPAKGKAKAVTSEAVSTASAAASTEAARYVFDQTTSKVGWVGSKVTGKHEGGFGSFRGTIDVEGGLPEKSKVEVDIDAGSITSDQEKLTGHLKSGDFFDVDKHPKARFVSTKIETNGAAYAVTGNLTIKGITKSITFPAALKVDGGQATVDAEFAINRRDFDLNYAGKPNDLIRDDVVIKLTIKAGKKTAS